MTEHKFQTVYEVGQKVFNIRVSPSAEIEVVQVEIKDVVYVLGTGKVIYLFHWSDNPNQEMQATAEYLFSTAEEAAAQRPRLAEETIRNRHEPYLEQIDKTHADQRLQLVNEMKKLRDSANTPFDPNNQFKDLTMSGKKDDVAAQLDPNAPVSDTVQVEEPLKEAQAEEAQSVEEPKA
jgi:hypothetical protein